ncbi:SDR family NAD(P)-dependent oxidoreductase [Raineyella sp. W15-4]|uniref:SDR family NAD(P)-dependent oxidoreductase n=1 Tax=Raineyella sp. W15-4 TaxID=3081651 RepID=UPI0029551E1B|nr:SDR family oxidoreductase [Raineyella sp. W15-4]WOQ17256.1 SDR family oxidoreductase [Raineyella sp. W15-4]
MSRPPVEQRRVAIVTGGVSGIGGGITTRLLRDGYRVVATTRTPVDPGATAERLGAEDGALAFANGDLAVPGAADRIVDAALEAFGQVDVLVNNAGGGVIRPTLDHTEETLESTIRNNLWTTIRSTLAVLPHFVAQGSGRIVNIGAESVRNGLTDHAIYNAAKGGVHALATGLAREFAGQGITVNVVAPSYTRTDELDALMAAGKAPARFGQVLSDALELIPMHRAAEVEDIAAAVSYLASEDAAFVTGQVLSVNGGSSMC